MSFLLLFGELIAYKERVIDFNTFKSRFKEKPYKDKP